MNHYSCSLQQLIIMNSHEQAEQRHQDTLVELIARLSRKKLGDRVMFMPNEEYSRTISDSHYAGEYDLHVRLKRNGKWFDRYYEVKGNDCPPRYNCATEQFERNEKAHPTGNWKYIYVTPTRVERYRPNNR